MDFVGHYLGLGNYKVIGELDQYPIPDVVINVKRYSDGEVLSVLVQRIKQLNISKKDCLFKIHIVVMLKMMMLLRFVKLYQPRVYHAQCLPVIVFRAKRRIRCLHGEKETSYA